MPGSLLKREARPLRSTSSAKGSTGPALIWVGRLATHTPVRVWASERMRSTHQAKEVFRDGGLTLISRYRAEASLRRAISPHLARRPRAPGPRPSRGRENPADGATSRPDARHHGEHVFLGSRRAYRFADSIQRTRGRQSVTQVSLRRPGNTPEGKRHAPC